MRAIERGEEIFVSYNYDPEDSYTPRYSTTNETEKRVLVTVWRE